MLIIQYISSDKMIVDILIKPLERPKFENLRDKVGIKPIENENDNR